MKKLILLCVGCVLIACPILFLSCSEPEEKPEEEEVELRPTVLDMDIVDSFYPEATATLPTRDSIRIFFNEVHYAEKVIDDIPHRAVIDMVTFFGASVTQVWSEDQLTLTLYPKEMLEANTSFTLKVQAHWERKESGTWRTVTYQDEPANQTVTREISTGNPDIKLWADNIKSLYPIPNQYHFLMDEYPLSFIELNRSQTSMFESATHTFVAIYTPPTGPAIESVATYDEAKKTVSFNTPDLQTQTIYKLSFVAREAANSKVLLEYHFRTSKYKTFTEKYNTVTFTGSTFSILADPWRGHYLYQFIATAGEYFDSFEAETKNERVLRYSSGGGTEDVPYASNLVRFQAVLTGTPWYNELYPLLYAPWTDPNFKPAVTRDTTRVGYPPVRAMSVYRFGEGKLTPEMIAANSAPALTVSESPVIRYCLALVAHQDFREVQTQAVNKYINQPTIPARENAIIWNAFPPIGSEPGTYPYKIKYTLPSGKVTTTISHSMTF